MPRSEQDDSRPILLRRSDRFPACLTVLGAKIDSVYDVEDALARRSALPRTPTPMPIPARRRMNESLISVVAPLEADADPASSRRSSTRRSPCCAALVTHYEIILVDDGAAEATVARVRALLGRYDFVRFLRLSRHFGEETAITAGLDVAIGDYVIVMLPNMDPPSLIPEFFERARSRGGHRLRRAPAPEERAVLVSRRRARSSIGTSTPSSKREFPETRRSSAA